MIPVLYSSTSYKSPFFPKDWAVAVYMKNIIQPYTINYFPTVYYIYIYIYIYIYLLIITSISTQIRFKLAFWLSINLLWLLTFVRAILEPKHHVEY